MRTDAIRESLERIPAILKEKRDVYSVELAVAERKTFLAKKRLMYSGRFRTDDEKNELRFTEMLIESGSGVSAVRDAFGPGSGSRGRSRRPAPTLAKA